eukprot:Hpha_TRINITY_DN7571_c0_g1::TRINITY_DN7571_c0_g1_i1::g.19085::m.19085
MHKAVDAHTVRGGKKVHGIEHQLPPGSPPRMARTAGRRNDGFDGRPTDSLGRGGDSFGCSPTEHKHKTPMPRHNHAQNEVTNHGTTLTGGETTRHGLHTTGRHNHMQNKQSEPWQNTYPNRTSRVNQTTFSFQDPPADIPAPKRDVKPDLVPDQRGPRHIRAAYKGYTTA